MSVAIGDDVHTAIVAAKEQLDIGFVKLFNDPAEMADKMAGEIDTAIIVSHTKNHARHALPIATVRQFTGIKNCLHRHRPPG